jgi:hypothetical protein
MWVSVPAMAIIVVVLLDLDARLLCGLLLLRILRPLKSPL